MASETARNATATEPVPSCTTPPLSATLPPLIFGTAAFNHQYNRDPFALGTTALVHEAVRLGIRAFDTSPYYGPAESLLGTALVDPSIREAHPRHTYTLLTKVGRVSETEFDYSATAVRRSVARSCERLGTDYLDVVYCHDVEFVSEAEVLEAVRELYRIRDEGLEQQGQQKEERQQQQQQQQQRKIRYVGISGYPLPVLLRLAKVIRAETGRPLDIIQSYAHFTLQNTCLGDDDTLAGFRDAGVAVVPNASPLGMGLLRSVGVPVGAKGDFHPAPPELRERVRRAAKFVEELEEDKRSGVGEKLEDVALRFALGEWARRGEAVGTFGEDGLVGRGRKGEEGEEVVGERKAMVLRDRKLGVSVMGVSTVEELHKTMAVWKSTLMGLEAEEGDVGSQVCSADATGMNSGYAGKDIQETQRHGKDQTLNLQIRRNVIDMADEIKNILQDYMNYSWDSPPLASQVK